MTGHGARVPAMRGRGAWRCARARGNVRPDRHRALQGPGATLARPQVPGPAAVNALSAAFEHEATDRHRGPDSGSTMAERFPGCTGLAFVLTPVQPHRMRAVYTPDTGGTRSTPKGTGRADNGRVGPWPAPVEGSELFRNPTELPAPLDLEQPAPLPMAGPGFLSTDEISPFRDLEE